MATAQPQTGHVYKIKNMAQGIRREAHGDHAWRPHGVVLASPDGLVNVAARGSTSDDYDRRRDFWSPKAPEMGLDKDGFFSARDRWYKSFAADELADGTKAKYLGPLPEPQFTGYCNWVDAL